MDSLDTTRPLATVRHCHWFLHHIGSPSPLLSCASRPLSQLRPSMRYLLQSCLGESESTPLTEINLFCTNAPRASGRAATGQGLAALERTAWGSAMLRRAAFLQEAGEPAATGSLADAMVQRLALELQI